MKRAIFAFIVVTMGGGLVNSATILTGHVHDVLPTLAPASFDAIVTDPPYGETSLAWDKRVPGWPALVRRLLKPSGSIWVFGSLRSHLATSDDFEGWRLAQDVIWEKHNGSGFDADRFRRVHEQVAHWYPAGADWAAVYKDPQRIAGEARPSAKIKARGGTPHRGKIGSGDGYDYTDTRLATSVIYCRSMHGRALHETHKPPELLEPLIRYSCPPGGVVLDPFAGSGSTGVACLRNGRSFVGVELRPEMAEIARRYIADDAPLLTRSEVG